MGKLESKIEGFVADCGCDAVMAGGVDNFNYLTRTVLPFANYYPDRKAVAVLAKDGRKMVLCPFDWVDAIKDQGWGGEIYPYDENIGDTLDPIINALKEALSSFDLARSVIGIDAHRVSKDFADLLSHSLPEVKWKPMDPLLKEMRMVKTQEEAELIEMAAKQLDRGIIHALNHLEGTVRTPGYTLAEFSERVRVHICENGASGIGHVATTLGSNSRHYYVPLRGQFTEGELFRVDVSSHYMGYWANLGRMAVTGTPTMEQAGAFEENLMLKFAAEDMLKPGVRCDEIYSEVKETAVKSRIPLWDEVSIGHGVGVSPHEPPYIDHSNMTELKPGMVLALDIYTKGPRNELIHSKDIYEVEEEGARLLSWYRNWDRLYEVSGFRAAH